MKIDFTVKGYEGTQGKMDEVNIGLDISVDEVSEIIDKISSGLNDVIDEQLKKVLNALGEMDSDKKNEKTNIPPHDPKIAHGKMANTFIYDNSDGKHIAEILTSFFDTYGKDILEKSINENGCSKPNSLADTDAYIDYCIRNCVNIDLDTTYNDYICIYDKLRSAIVSNIDVHISNIKYKPFLELYKKLQPGRSTNSDDIVREAAEASRAYRIMTK
jgi:hypothetical protein